MIRILRLIEYNYESYEQAEDDMKNWGVPAFGSRQFGNKTIYSAILPPTTELMKENDPPEFSRLDSDKVNDKN